MKSQKSFGYKQYKNKHKWIEEAAIYWGKQALTWQRTVSMESLKASKTKTDWLKSQEDDMDDVRRGDLLNRAGDLVSGLQVSWEPAVEKIRTTSGN